jgi:ankyrin repeat protein
MCKLTGLTAPFVPFFICSLMFASGSGHMAAVNLLLDSGCVPDVATVIHDDQGGETALHLASYAGHSEVVQRLLRAGCNPNAQMRNGRTPLILSCEMGWGEIVHSLLTRSFIHPVDLHLTTDSGKSALYCACEHGHDAIVPILLDAGSNVSQATRRNKIPLYVAAEKGFLSIAKMLLEHADATGADAFVRTKYGTTPMFIASRTNNKAMKELLMSYAVPEKAGKHKAAALAQRGRSLNSRRVTSAGSADAEGETNDDTQQA